MFKKVKRLIKKAGKGYIKGYCNLYRPTLEHGVNPFV